MTFHVKTSVDSIPEPKKPKDLMRIADVAEYMSMSRTSVYRAMWKGAFEVTEVGGVVLIKKSSVICYTPQGLLADAPATQTLAQGEGLWAHALSAGLRRRVLTEGAEAVTFEALAQADLTAIAWPEDDAATVAAGARAMTASAADPVPSASE